MVLPTQWQQFYTLVFGQRGRGATIVPIFLTAEFVRIEIVVLTFPRPTWYKAGWVNQAPIIAGKPHLMPGQVCTLAPAIFKFEAVGIYQVRFKPVPYLPSSIVKFYRSL